jgi:transposase
MKKQKNQQSYATKSIPVINPYAAGIDIGATEIYVAVPSDQDPQPVKMFQAFTEDLQNLIKWLTQCHIKTVAMESTGVYWIPVFQMLEEAGFEVCLVNARHIKNVPGKKTDVVDCQWIQYLHAVGLLRSSFRPSGEICAIRSILRHRDGLIQEAASSVQHMQKALTQMNLHLHNVISDITGVTGLSIIDAILAGERDPQELAKLRDKRIKAKEDTLSKSLVGNYRPEHLFTLRQAHETYRHYQKLILECDCEIKRMLKDIDGDEDTTNTQEQSITNQEKKGFNLENELTRIFGVNLTEIPGIGTRIAQTIFAEIGNDLSSFPSAKHFTSWLGLSPDNRISGGRVLSAKTREVKNRAAYALRMAALSAGNSYTAVGEFFRRMKVRCGVPKAITATANKIARIIYSIIKNKKPYNESEFQDNEKRYKERAKAKLKRQASELGYELIPINEVPQIV